MTRLIGGGMIGPPYWRGLKWMGAEQLDRIVHSDIIHEMTEKTPLSTLGEWPDDDILPNTIAIEVSHELS